MSNYAKQIADLQATRKAKAAEMKALAEKAAEQGRTFDTGEQEQFDALKADISANGLRQPIVLLDGMILDGGNRYRACIDAGVKPVFTDYNGGNIVSFVLSANLHRRHMTPGQQAAIVARRREPSH